MACYCPTKWDNESNINFFLYMLQCVSQGGIVENSPKTRTLLLESLDVQDIILQLSVQPSQAFFWSENGYRF